MLEAFFKTHDFLVEHAKYPIRRQLMDEIKWDNRMIAIKGARGVGKTDFLLVRAKELDKMEQIAREAHLATSSHRSKSDDSRSCLYVNMNDLYFAEHSLVEFAGKFVKAGGQTLLLDNVFKIPNWSHELRKCYDRYHDLKIVFAASPVMPLEEDNRELSNVVDVYNLRGFSFREYLCLQTNRNFRSYSLEEILHNHEIIAREICELIHPMDYFRDYLNHGYYPSYRENSDFDSELLKTINTVLEVDVLIIRQIEVSLLPKLRKLLYQMLLQTPCSLNISSVSEEIELSRATTMNYIKYLKDARLLNLLYQEGKQFPMKPSRIYTQNTNIIHLIHPDIEPQEMYEIYFYNVMHMSHKVNSTERSAMFVVDGKYYFDVRAKAPDRESIRPTAIGDIEMGRGNAIPLWLLGFLY